MTFVFQVVHRVTSLQEKRGLLLDESEKSHGVLFERPKFIMRNTMYDTST